MESYTYSPDKKSSTECRTSNFAICTTFLRTQNVDDFISEKICFILMKLPCSGVERDHCEGRAAVARRLQGTSQPRTPLQVRLVPYFAGRAYGNKLDEE